MILAHLPPASRPVALAELRRAWALPPEEAADALETLAHHWHKGHPGAASYLLRHRDATLTAARLRLPAALSRRLVTLAPLRTLWQRSLRASPPQAAGVAAVRSGLASWRPRRLQGYQALSGLARALKEHAAQAAKEQPEVLAETNGHANPLA